MSFASDATAARRSRRAASMMFLVDGVGFGVWAALLPSLQRRLEIGDGDLSVILLLMAAGAMAAMGVVGRVVARCGSRTTLRWVAPMFCLALCLPAVSRDFSAVAAAAILLGALKGCFDVTVNAQSIVVEKALDRPVLSSFQAWWSFGGLGAAGLTGLALKLGAAPVQITLLVAAILLLLSLLCPRDLLHDVESVPSGRRVGPVFNPRLALIGVLAFAALFAEGVMMDWSAIYAQRVAGAADWLAPFAYGIFCTAMGVGRLSGDRLMSRFEPRMVVRCCGALGAAGLLLMVLVPYLPATFVGLAAVGLGFANLVPVFLGAASRARPDAVARAVASVSMIGYTGFLAGPPVVGLLSDFAGLPATFGAVAVLALAIGWWGPALLERSPRKEEQEAYNG
ncbi:MFS transporter [Luteolibacter marinus]|uniref:MFS transporter n=1 Tax=Luteolibacter marinus TaxID=2776705 RepID=UPI001865E15E|nr:MFS transporter [Luteolibacter marinus]